MKYGLGGSIFQIAVAEIDMTILMSNRRKVPIRAFLAFPKRVEIAKERDIAVFTQTKSRIIIGPGLIETISKRKAAATRRNMIIDTVAEMKKSM